MEVLNNLKKYRIEKGFSQQRLAEIAECDRSYISEVENGKQKLTLKMASKFGEAMSIPAFDILGADAIKYRGSFSESLQALVLGSFSQFIDNMDIEDEYSYYLFMILYPIFRDKFSLNDIKILQQLVDSLGEKYGEH